MKLGSKTKAKYRKPNLKILETFPNPNTKRDCVITHTCLEFTSLCPITGQPDFGCIRISYIADKLCVETKSLKFYLFAYRQTAGFMEALVNRICDDLAKVLQPRRLEVKGIFNTRGGVRSKVKCTL